MEENRNPIRDIDTIFDRLTILELAVADLYEQLNTIEEEQSND